MCICALVSAFSNQVQIRVDFKLKFFFLILDYVQYLDTVDITNDRLEYDVQGRATEIYYFEISSDLTE